MMLALDFRQPVADRGEEILIGGEDGAVEIEFDDRLRTADGGNLAGILHVADFLLRDVGGEFDDFDGPAGRDPRKLCEQSLADLDGRLESR